MSIKTVSSATLKKKLKNGGFNDQNDNYIRIHRSISWIKAAEESSQKIDFQFISLWIAFNCCYTETNNTSLEKGEITREKKNYKDFIQTIDTLNQKGDYFSFLWLRFSNEIKSVIHNKFLYQGYWNAINEQEEFSDEIIDKYFDRATSYLEKKDAVKLLGMVLDNLYVLRNQLIHGNSTYGSKVNRLQIKHGITILQHLNTINLETMIAHPNHQWGAIKYPVINKEKFFK